jgi:hypothetical protein
MSPVTACQREGLEQSRHAMVEDGMVVAACFVAQRACNPTLADSGRTSVTMPGVWDLRCRSSTRSIPDVDTWWAFSAASNTVARSTSSSGSQTAH